MMKKTIVLAVAALFATTLAASAEKVNVPLFTGLNMLAAPQAPIYAEAPETVFADASSNPLSIGFNLTRWDAVNKGYIAYSPFNTADYGGVLLGDGAWYTSDADVVWQYDAAPNGLPDASGVKTDMWISLPAAGLALFGNPFNDSIDWISCLMTDGTQTVSVEQAANLGWFDGSCIEWSAQDQGYTTVGTMPWYKQTIDPGHAYWITTAQDNLALIVPAKP